MGERKREKEKEPLRKEKPEKCRFPGQSTIAENIDNEPRTC